MVLIQASETQMTKREGITNNLLALVLGALVLVLAVVPDQKDTALLFSLFFPAFAVYYLLTPRLLTLGKQASYRWLVGAVLLRLLLIVPFPNLSDDFYRFFWDGLLWSAGINPFDSLPSQIISERDLPPGISLPLFNALNSPDYYTVYPPMSQLVFWVSVQTGLQTLQGAMLSMKILLFIPEAVIILWLLPNTLKQMGRPANLTFWYAFHPLVLLEISGNMHFEGMTLSFLLAALLFIHSQKLWKLSSLFTLAVATKLVPLLYVPILLPELGKKQVFPFLLLTGSMLTICFIPLLTGTFFTNFFSSIDLYFRTFEFNASIYFLARWVGFQLTGYNQIAVIGPLLSVLTAVSVFLIGFLRWSRKTFSLTERLLLASTIFLFLSTTVHPWYILPLVGLAPLTRFTFPYVWAGFAFLSYAHYGVGQPVEPTMLILLEYAVTWIFLITELRRVITRHSN